MRRTAAIEPRENDRIICIMKRNVTHKYRRKSMGSFSASFGPLIARGGRALSSILSASGGLNQVMHITSPIGPACYDELAGWRPKRAAPVIFGKTSVVLESADVFWKTSVELESWPA